MLNLGIAFAPLVAEPVLWAAVAAAIVLALLLFVSRSRGATIRALSAGHSFPDERRIQRP